MGAKSMIIQLLFGQPVAGSSVESGVERLQG
jgi:hypothetical protein